MSINESLDELFQGWTQLTMIMNSIRALPAEAKNWGLIQKPSQRHLLVDKDLRRELDSDSPKNAVLQDIRYGISKCNFYTFEERVHALTVGAIVANDCGQSALLSS